VIVRVLRGHVPARNVDRLWSDLAERMDGVAPPDGQLNAEFGRQVHADGSESFVYVTTWLDMAAVYSWVGGPSALSQPRLLRGLEHLLDEVDVQHYIGSSLQRPWEFQPADRPRGAGSRTGRERAAVP
jgi:hypothetical protein